MTTDQLVLDEGAGDYRDPALRLSRLLDANSAVPLHESDDGAVLAMKGRIDGVDVVAYCTDARVMGGSMTASGCRHIVDAIDTAVRDAQPGDRPVALRGRPPGRGRRGARRRRRVFAAMISASGQVPQISVVLGPAAGGAAYGPALTDIVIMSDEGRVFVTGPDVVRSGHRRARRHDRARRPRRPRAQVRRRPRGGRLRGRRDPPGPPHARCSWPAWRLPIRAGADPVPTCATCSPDSARRAYDVRPLYGSSRPRRLPRTPGPLGAQHRGRLRPAVRRHHRGDRQQPAAQGRLPRLAERGEGGAVRAHVRRVRRPDARPRGRARLPARRRAGVGRGRTARGQAPVRLRRVRGAADHAHHQEVLRRRLHRDELPRRSAPPPSSPGPRPRSG